MLPNLSEYLEASLKQLQACIANCEYTFSLDESKATAHLQYVKFDPINGEPKFNTLAKVLAKHVVRFSLSASTRELMRKELEDPDEGDLLFKARDYFRKIEDSGEVGELLLFFLLEAAFGAPQVVCKMELKTNPGDEVKGTDGIHVKWDTENDHLDIFLGESKLYADLGKALTSIFDSITTLYDLDRIDDELHLVTAHFKHLDSETQSIITSFINRASPQSNCHIIHACLVGFDWDEYILLLNDRRQDFFQQFETYYKKHAATIQDMLNFRFKKCKHKHISFKFLFIPFRDVSEFRRAFYKALLGVDIAKKAEAEAPASAPAKAKEKIEPKSTKPSDNTRSVEPVPTTKPSDSSKRIPDAPIISVSGENVDKRAGTKKAGDAS